MDPLSKLQSYLGREFPESPSPFTSWLKPVIVAAERGKLSFRYEVRHDMTNPLKGLHGGVTAAIMDDIIGATLYSLNEDFFYTTVNNVVDYFAPAREGETITAETLIVRKGKQLANVQCEIWDESHSRLIARGYSNLIKTSITKTNLHQKV